MSLIEVMGMIVIISLGLISIWQIIHNGQKLATNTENRIKAINIAREGVEIATNIRDTNWTKFSSAARRTCWNVDNYDTNCIGNSNLTTRLSGSYIGIMSGTLWYLVNSSNTGVYLDANGLAYQSTGSLSLPSCTSQVLTGCTTRFYRSILVSPDGDPTTTSGMLITSTVQWQDGQTHSISLETMLMNWRVNF